MDTQISHSSGDLLGIHVPKLLGEGAAGDPSAFVLFTTVGLPELDLAPVTSVSPRTAL